MIAKYTKHQKQPTSSPRPPKRQPTTKPNLRPNFCINIDRNGDDKVEPIIIIVIGSVAKHAFGER